MKTKSLLTIICLFAFCFSQAILTVAIADENTTDPYEKSAPNWLKNHTRAKRAVRDSISVGVEASLDGDDIGSVGISATITWEFVECCKYTSKPYHYCDAALQDKRC